jgi:small subunit ribosomal protein S16
MGAKKNPFYRVVVADQRSPRDGRFIEAIGTYDPHPEPPKINIDVERVTYWINSGAQPSDSVASLLRQAKIVDESGKLVGAVTEDEESEGDEVVVEETAEAAADA